MTEFGGASRGGCIVVLCGCMFAGKTSALIAALRDAAASGLRTVAIKHSLDARYARTDLATHDGRSFPAFVAARAVDILPLAEDADVIAIDEAQFFGEALVAAAERLRQSGKRVIIAGIDFDIWGRPFAPLPQLRRIADAVREFHIPCTRCGAPATLNQRVTPIVDGQLVGGPSDYEPRCPACFVPCAALRPD